MFNSAHYSAYIEVNHLTNGHSDTINTLCFSPDGTHLVSGGDDRAMCIWNILKGQLLYRLLFDEAVDCVLWHPTHPETVIVGLSNGYLGQVYGFSLLTNHRHDIRLGARSAVYCLDYDPSTTCLAIGMGEEVHITREVSSNCYDGDIVFPKPPEPDSMNSPRDTRLRAVYLKFHRDGSNLIVCYIGHGIICWDTTKRDMLWRLQMPDHSPNIGGAALSPSHRHLAVYNVVDGLGLYDVGRNGKSNPGRTYMLREPPKYRHHLQVHFIHDGRALICGTTNGQITLWNSATGEALQELSHNSDIIQAIGTIQRARERSSLVATGSADKGQETYIKIWRARIDAGESVMNAPDVVAKLIQDVLGQQTLRDGLTAVVGLVLFSLITWVSAKVPWPTVWTILHPALKGSDEFFQVIYIALTKAWTQSVKYMKEWGSTAVLEFTIFLRNALLSFLFPDGADHPPGPLLEHGL